MDKTLLKNSFDLWIMSLEELSLVDLEQHLFLMLKAPVYKYTLECLALEDKFQEWGKLKTIVNPRKFLEDDFNLMIRPELVQMI